MRYSLKAISVGPLATQCYIAAPEDGSACCVIDPGANAKQLLSACGGKTIAAILLTHGHADHIGAVGELMKQAPGAALIVPEGDADFLGDTYLNCSDFLPGGPCTAPEATRLVRDGDTIEAAGLTFTVLHTPGHTPGSSCYRLDKDLFTGDTLFHYGYGRTDLPGGS